MLEKPALRYVGLLATCGLLLAYFMITQHKDDTLSNGSMAPLSTVVTSYDGKQWSLNLFLGKPMLINFWATWCPPCVGELPELAQAAHQLKDRVQIIGLAVDSPPSDVSGLVKQYQVSYPVAAATNQTLNAWHAHSLPITYLVDAKGKIVWKQVGPTNWSEIHYAIDNYLEN